MNVAQIVAGAENAASVLKILAPVAEQVAAWLEGGPEPQVFASYPSELQSAAALERARYRARVAAKP